MEIIEVLLCCLVPIAFISFATAHGSESHKQAPIVSPDADWATKHMAEEHHIGNFDGGAFFKIHDYDGDGDWDEWEIQKTYGLMDQTARDTPQEKRDQVVKAIMGLIDKDGNHRITRDEWMRFLDGGGTLPDLGTGPGHHGDIEYEYEIHHWEKYHDENTKLEDLIHPEDIEHFKQHDQLEDEAERVAKMDRLPIVEQNIPEKFRRILGT